MQYNPMKTDHVLTDNYITMTSIFNITQFKLNPKHYNFETDVFDTAKTSETTLNRVSIPSTGIYTKTIKFPTVTSNDQYDFTLIPDVHGGTTLADSIYYLGTNELNLKTVKNPLHYTKSIQQKIGTIITMSPATSTSGDFASMPTSARLSKPSHNPSVYNFADLKRYRTALIKRQWWQNLSKFNGTAMLGGVKHNGPELFSTAIAEQQKLEEEIRLNYEEPAHMQQG